MNSKLRPWQEKTMHLLHSKEVTGLTLYPKTREETKVSDRPSYLVYGYDHLQVQTATPSLAKHFNLRYVVALDDKPSNPKMMLSPNTLYLSREKPDWTRKQSTHVLSFDEACKRAGITP